MILLSHETERFYRIWWALLRYVNVQRHIMAELPASPAVGGLPPSEAIKIRNALWADNALREQFIAENPANLSPADLALVASWQYRVAGKFFILKHLKKYSVFLHQVEGQPARAYGVLGLISPLSEIVGPYLPVLVEAVLLPFEDKIIYDSLLLPYRITFGPGIRGNLNNDYRDTQEREGVITSLLPTVASLADEEALEAVQDRSRKILNAFRKDLYRSGLSPKIVEQHVGHIERFADEYLLAQTPPRLLRDMIPNDVQTYLAATSGSLKEQKAVLTSFKRFIRFLYDTGRMDPGVAYDFQGIIKRFRP